MGMQRLLAWRARAKRVVGPPQGRTTRDAMNHREGYRQPDRGLKALELGEALKSFQRAIGKIVGEGAKFGENSRRMWAALDRREQLVIEALVGQQGGSCALHACEGGAGVARRGKQQILDQIDLIAEVDEPEAGLQNTYIGLATRCDYLLLAEPVDMAPDLLLLGEIEKVLLERLREIAQVLPDVSWQSAFFVYRALQGDDDGDPEIAEQAGKAPYIPLDAGTGALVDL